LPIAAGRHTLVVSAPNYGVSKRILLVPEQSSAFVALAQSLEEVQVDSTPTGAAIFIDGTPKGRTPANLHLSAGPHQVRIVNDDWKDERTIQVEPGSLNSFIFKLGP
jgi:hypothetical protein